MPEMNYWADTWDLNENVCPCDVHFTGKTRKRGHLIFYMRSMSFDRAKPITAKWEKTRPVTRVGEFKTLLVYRKM